MTAASRPAANADALVVPFASSYEEFAPPADLRATVACTWTARVGTRDVTLDPVIADACSDIVVVGDDAPHIAGPATRTHDVALAPGSVVTGIRFLPGAARAAFGCSAAELLDAHVDLRDVCGHQAASLERALRAARSASFAREALITWARERLRRAAFRDASVLRAARELVAHPSLTISELGDSLGWSARHLHREFTATCGYGPKHLQRILRMQRVVRRARRDGGRVTSLSTLALDAGYADQAHMTREFRDITGFTPRELLALGRHDVGRWLDGDASRELRLSRD